MVFDLNMEYFKKTGLPMGSKLLQLAKKLQ